YQQVLIDQSVHQALTRSILLALSSATVATMLGTLAAIAVSRSGRWGRALLEVSGQVALLIPEIVFALSLLTWFFLLGWPLSLGTVFVAHVTFSVCFVLMTVLARLHGFDPSVENAARDLGASEARVLWTITLPLLRPAILSGFVLALLISFDDFLITFFVNGVGTDTLPVKLYTSLKSGLSPKLNALAALMSLCTAVLLVLLFRSPLGVSWRRGHGVGLKSDQS
ncbi:MAG: ABC transporter permease, partial [Bdellovibrionaceae bacterium]|nr:ABC transporter permease [Pseudobdellovibrionaceae bacterium]